MFCKAYRCEMEEAACVVRRRNALDGRRERCNRAGFKDIVCINCAQGAKISKQIDPKEVEEYSDQLRRIKESARERLKKNT